MSRRLLLALALSVAVHVALILSLPFELIHVEPRSPAPRLKVSMVHRVPEVPVPSEPRAVPVPSEPRAFAQKLRTPREPAGADEVPQPVAPPRHPEQLETPASSLPSIEALRSGWKDADGAQSSAPAPVRLTDAPGLDATERAYLDAWQRKVQRIGRLNFPTDEQGERLRGSLRLLAGIDRDGALVYARITVSSGDERLDQAAIRIVELAAPYAPLPPTLRRGASILEIERTWRIGARKTNHPTHRNTP